MGLRRDARSASPARQMLLRGAGVGNWPVGGGGVDVSDFRCSTTLDYCALRWLVSLVSMASTRREALDRVDDAGRDATLHCARLRQFGIRGDGGPVEFRVVQYGRPSRAMHVGRRPRPSNEDADPSTLDP